MADRDKIIRELIDELIKQKGDCIVADEKYSILSFVLDALIKKRKEEFLQSLGIDTENPDREKELIDALTLYKKLVRCKDCKYWLYESYCDKHDKGQENADWFCAGGERREDE